MQQIPLFLVSKKEDSLYLNNRGGSQNSLCRPNWMILTSVRFFANRHILLVIGGLREIRIRRQKRKFGPKWSFAISSLVSKCPYRYDRGSFLKGFAMARICALTGKKSSSGRSYALRGIAKKKKGIGLKITGITNRRFLPNLKVKRIWVPEENRYVTLRLSTSAIRTIDKNGIGSVLRKMRSQGKRA